MKILQNLIQYIIQYIYIQYTYTSYTVYYVISKITSISSYSVKKCLIKNKNKNLKTIIKLQHNVDENGKWWKLLYKNFTKIFCWITRNYSG